MSQLSLTDADRAEMLAAIDHCVLHLVQGLDRLAVCVAVTGALRVKLLTLDWNELAELQLTKLCSELKGRGRLQQITIDREHAQLWIESTQQRTAAATLIALMAHDAHSVQIRE